MPPDYQFEGEALVVTRDITTADVQMVFRAEQVRMERTGVHAKLTILANSTALAWSTFNVERDEDRLRLANSAYKHLDSLKNIYPPTYLKADLDNFCYGLFDAHNSTLLGEPMAGSLDRHPPEYLLMPFILQGGGTIVFAPPGRGKSYLLMLMAVSIDTGLQDLWPVARRRVLFINLERSPRSVADRLGNINAVLGLDRDRKLLTQNARGKSLADITSAAERTIKDHGVDCILVDSISRAGQGDLNDNQSTNRIIDVLNRLCPTWLALAHTPRGDESHLFGSVHFEAGADIVAQLLSEQDEDGPLGLGLQITKNNDVGKQPMWLRALDFDTSGLVAVRRARPGEFPDVEASKRMSIKETIRQHLLDVGAQDATEIAEETGLNRSVVANLLSRDHNTFMKGPKLGRRQLYAIRA